jgi:hypothetical protein
MALTDQIILNSLSSIRSIEDSFTNELVSVMGKLESQLIQQIGVSSAVDVAETALARQNIERILLDSGYYETTGRLLSDGYQAAIQESFNIYRESIGESFQFSDVSLDRLNTLKSMDLQQLTRLGDDFATDMTRVLLDLQFGSLSQAQAIDAIRSNVGKFSGYAQTWVTTGLSGIYRESNLLMAQDNGITKYVYVGPLDRITRHFCRDLLRERGKQYTQAEIDKMNNGQINPVSTFAGGYNCRHQWVGVK